MTTSPNTTTKKDLIERIAGQTRVKRSVAKKVLQCFLDNVISEMQAGRRLELRSFGIFEVRERAARMAQNPKTMEPVPVPPRKTVKFKVGRLLRDALDGRMPNGLTFIYEDDDDEDDEEEELKGQADRVEQRESAAGSTSAGE